ncbi:MAG: DUF1028 domain-containing protein [Verrucomicrobiales bacterium]|nr:DUF1028 domain-containing protein [Verrucomicrobiales bacterium]
MKWLLPVFLLFSIPGFSDEPPTVATFSIVAIDKETGEIGIGVQSKIVGVGAVVPFAQAGVGAVATQASANVRFGPVGLLMLQTGSTPEQAIEMLTRADSGSGRRQIGIVSANGKSATFTGEKCKDWAGGMTGDGYAVQGNILAGESVVTAMAEAFEKTGGVLAERLLAALEAGQAEGGDKRGKQSAALLIVREGWGYGGGNDKFRDVRVDEHAEPIKELRRVYNKHRELFPRPDRNKNEPEAKSRDPDAKAGKSEKTE